MKRCHTCKAEKSYDEFDKSYSRKDGWQVACKSCMKARLRTFHKVCSQTKAHDKVLRRERRRACYPFSYLITFNDGTYYAGSTSYRWKYRLDNHIGKKSVCGIAYETVGDKSIRFEYFDTKLEARHHEDTLIDLDDVMCLNKNRAVTR